LIRASVPVRVCDVGGWTDTWFGEPGRVVNVAVGPGVEVTVVAGNGPEAVVLHVGSFGDRYAVEPGAGRDRRHPLLEAAVDALPPPPGTAVELSVRSEVPAGCGTGTSAAVAVGAIGALAAVRGDQMPPRQAAYLAHRLEVEVLGEESGIQDQLASAFGGINYLSIDRYPAAQVEALPYWEELGSHLSVVYLGRAHDSSALHREVIKDVISRGPSAFERMREAAGDARRAVALHDLELFSRALVAANDAMGTLHPDLIGTDARRVLDLAHQLGALGWKVNGAGGDGGSVAVLSASAEDKAVLEAALAGLGPGYRALPLSPVAAGLEVTGTL
jgi:D-glycero-alpha-D-manno-heptose-7-phosphate kinase